MKMLFAAVALTVAAHGPARPADYAGSWTLDAARSRNLPEYYSRVKSHALVITQDDAHLNVGVAIDIGEAQPDRFDLVYTLDGNPVETETRIRTPDGLASVPTTLRATVDGAGAVHIAITRRITSPSGPFVAETREDWALSPDGRTLTIHRVDNTRRGQMEADMVFARS
jgi:hypothetical protein